MLNPYSMSQPIFNVAALDTALDGKKYKKLDPCTFHLNALTREALIWEALIRLGEWLLRGFPNTI
jgi:hypothetical protein